jgi:uncharacterized membrane protein HdeD (DUF308 family)
MAISQLPDLSQTVKKGAGWVVALGVLTILLGIFAISSPLFVGIAVQYFVGAALLVGGIFQIVHALKGNGSGKSFFAILSGILSIACGSIMFSKPLFGLGVITLFLIAYFIMDGFTKIIYGFKHRPESGWGWVLFSGIISLFLGLAIWRQWPVSGAWAIGTLFGINLIVNGWTMIFTGSAVRESIKAHQPIDV